MNKGKVQTNKIKQSILAVIALLLFAFGFISYKPENSEELTKQYSALENENADMIGDVELVSSGSIVENEEVVKKDDIVENPIDSKDSDYFENIRMERDSMYSKMLETYYKMLDNEKLVETQKNIAVQEIAKITNNQNAIMISENLIINKGFEDAVVLANSDIINVIVKASFLSNEDIGKIQNIIEREFRYST